MALLFWQVDITTKTNTYLETRRKLSLKFHRVYLYKILHAISSHRKKDQLFLEMKANETYWSYSQQVLKPSYLKS